MVNRPGYDPTEIIRSYVSENTEDLNASATQNNDGEYGEVVQQDTNINTGTVQEESAISQMTLEQLDSFFNQTGPQPNPLNEFASYNYIITMGCLSNDELNKPDTTYRTSGLNHILCKSAGGAGDAKVLTAFERNGKKIEFYIDNLEMKQIIQPNPRTRTTNATNITFDIVEPYSMGLFIQAMQIAAREAGHRNFIEAPYCLVIEFIGYDSNGNSYVPPNTRRMFPFKWTSGEFEVTNQGSVYNMVGVPYNEQALADTVQTLPIDIELTGRSLNEITQTGVGSLAATINTHLLTNRNQTSGVEPDEYVFIFPKDRSSLSTVIENTDGDAHATARPTEGPPGNRNGYTDADRRENFDLQESIASIRDSTVYDESNTQQYADYVNNQLGYVLRRSNLGEAIKSFNENDENVNEVGSSTIEINDPLGTGTVPFGQASFNFDFESGLLKRDNITIDPTKRSISFKKGEKLQRILEELVLISSYGENANPEKPSGPLGMINWFRIEANIYNLSNARQEAQTGRPPRVIVYRLLPWQAHKSIFAPPNAPVSGYENIERQIAREYHYMYTGKNLDVLNFNLQFKNAFFQAISPTANRNRDSVNLSSQASANASEEASTQQELEEAPAGVQGDGGTLGIRIPDEAISGGAVTETGKITLARQFNDAIINSDVDLVSTSMTIWGDPYYLADSGMGNYTAQEGNGINLTSDNTMDYQSGQVDIKVNFRTPIDIRETGEYDFGQDVLVENFSGLYMVNTLVSMFQGGQFKQELNMIRRPNQELRDIATEEERRTTRNERLAEEKRTELRDRGFSDQEIAAYMRIQTDGDYDQSSLGELNAADTRDVELYQAALERERDRNNLAQVGVRRVNGRVVGGL